MGAQSKEQLNPRGSRKDHRKPNIRPMVLNELEKMGEGVSRQRYQQIQRETETQLTIKKLNEFISKKLPLENKLTVSAWNSNSSNRKLTGWCYLKSRAFSAVRKP